MKKQVGVTLDPQIMHTLEILYVVRRYFFEEKGITRSGIIETAIKEYFDNHREEINTLMDEYHERGGAFKL